MVGASLSYRKGVDLINRVLHRGEDTAIKICTYRDFCERTGKRIEEQVAEEAKKILETHHFDGESGKATESIAAELRESSEPYGEEAFEEEIREINVVRPLTEEQVKTRGWEIERPAQTCYISLDEIGVKHQKEHRTADEEKRGVYVWNTVADIETASGSHMVTGIGMRKTFLLVLAYLLQSNLLANKTLVFFTDGARNIFTNIAEIFSFHPYIVILDWFHLKKRCQEYLSMSVKGKDIRNEILQKLLRILWAGNVDEAIAYLRNLDKNILRPSNKIGDLCQYMEKHREHIPPYALRAKLGLRNSSNRVEKANDLCVAQRQKHNGMSWSNSGSGALAQIVALILNDNLHSWLYSAPFTASSSLLHNFQPHR